MSPGSGDGPGLGTDTTGPGPATVNASPPYFALATDMTMGHMRCRAVAACPLAKERPRWFASAVWSPIRIDPSLRPGLTFMTLHFQDEVQTNILTIDATDPKSGTAEFKATAIRIEKLGAAVPA